MPATGCYVVPGGWTLVAFAGSQGSSCPVPSTQTDVYEGPNASTACVCNCLLMTPPTCPQAPIDVHYDTNQGSPSCGATGAPSQMNDTSANCNTDMYTGPNPYGYSSFDLKYSPTAVPTGGQCNSSSLSQPQNVSYSAHDRVCQPNTEPCTGSQCTPSFGSYQVCITTSGSQSCPGTTFTQQHVVGGAATYTCASSGCGCNVTAGKCIGTMKLFTDGNCMSNELDIPADDGCHNSNTSTDHYNSYKYTPGALLSSCVPTGTSAAQNVMLPGEQTICCAP